MEDLTRDAILGADDLPRREVEVPEWGGRLWVRTMTGLERDRYEAGLVVEPGTKRADRLANLRARLVALTAVDAAGERLFAETDVEALGAKSSKALDRVADAALKMNGLGPDDVEELVGNSVPGPDDASV